MTDKVQQALEWADNLPDNHYNYLFSEEVKTLSAEVKRLRVIDSGMTHYEGCYDQGAAHYKCALEEVNKYKEVYDALEKVYPQLRQEIIDLKQRAEAAEAKVAELEK